MDEMYQGTISGAEDFDPEKAATRLCKAMRGMGTDERMIIDVMVKHNSIQRQEIEEKYKAMYGKDLIEDLKEELGGHFEDTVVAMLTSPRDYEILNIRDALVNGDEKTLIELLCGKSTDDIDAMSSWYRRATDETLDEAIASNLSGDFKALIRGIVATGRDQDDNKDNAKAIKDAQDLYDAGIGMNAGTDESEFIRILNTRSYPQLLETFGEYEKIAQESISDSIDKEFSGDIKKGLTGVVQRIQDQLGFYAERLHNCIDGPGTDDRSLIRILVLRSEIDLADIKTRYKEMYTHTLAQDVKDDTSGDYRKLLLAIIGN